MNVYDDPWCHDEERNKRNIFQVKFDFGGLITFSKCGKADIISNFDTSFGLVSTPFND